MDNKEITLKFLSYFEGHTTITCQSKKNQFFSYNKPITEIYPILKENNGNGFNIYFTVNETSEAGRKIENLESIRAIFADDDTLRSEPLEFPLTPSFIIQTSEHEGKFKHQYLWLTKTPLYEEWIQVMEGIVSKYSMDPGAKDLARILRVPGFNNHKYSPACLVGISGGNAEIYEWITIVKHFPPSAATDSKPNGNGVQQSGEVNVHGLAAEFLSGDNITNPLNSLIMHWRHHYSDTGTKDLVDQLFEQIPEATMEQYKDRFFTARGQVDKFIKTAAKAVHKYREPTLQTKVVDPGIPQSLETDWTDLKCNPLPLKEMPENLVRAALEIGDWAGVGPDPAFLSGLFVTSALLSKNVLIHEIADNLKTHAQCGVVIVMDTGARKSSIYEQMNRPFFDFEKQLKEQWKKDKPIADGLAKALSMDQKKHEREYNKIKDPTDGETLAFAERLGRIAEKVDSLQLKEPWLQAVDITEEKLIRKLHDNKGCIAIISDDARSVLNNLAGKYNQKEGGSGETIYINALTGSPILYERVGKEQEVSIHIEHPVLNALLFVQPDIALKLKNSQMFVGSGLAARLPMYFYPVSGKDIVANTTRRVIEDSEMQPYFQALKGICKRRIDNPLHVRLSDKGMETTLNMTRKFGSLLDGKWSGHYDKSNKVVTLSLIYATCFAALSDPNFTAAFSDTEVEESNYVLPIKYLNMGFIFAEALFSQSIVSFKRIDDEGLHRKTINFVTLLTKHYEIGRYKEGFVVNSYFARTFGVGLKDQVPEIVDFLFEKKWLYTTLMTDDKRKLNAGHPGSEGYVDQGDIIYHLNLGGIKKKEIEDNKPSTL